MNILMNTMTTSVSQLSQMNSGYKANALSNAFQSQERGSDEMSISPEGKAMSQMMRAQEGKDAREAQRTAFTETYEELSIESLNAEDMTDEEISEVLASFESSMGEYMNEGYKPSVDMDSSELRDALNNIKDVSANMSEAKGSYGPPKGGPPKGGGPKGVKPAQAAAVTETDTESDDDDLIATLLEALEEDADESYDAATAYEDIFMAPKSMTEILSLMNQSSSNM